MKLWVRERFGLTHASVGGGWRRWLSGMLVVAVLVATLSPRASLAQQAKQVEDLSEQAMLKYQAGDYNEAITLYLRAYQMQPSARLLYNVATIYDRKLGERGLGLEHYRRYVNAADAEPELVQKALARMQVLKDLIDKVSAAQAPRSPSPAAETAPAATASATTATATRTDTPLGTTAQAPRGGGMRPLKLAGWAAGGVGVASLVAGTVFAVKARNENSTAKDTCSGGKCTTQAGVDASSRALTWAHRADWAFGAGVAVTAAGVAMLLWPQGNGTTAAASPSANGTGLVVAVQGVW
jgi:hypothetical protein